MMRRPVFFLFLSLCAWPLGGCQSYHPAPMDAAALALARQQRPIDAGAVQAEQAQIAPAASYDATHWTRLSLLAALLVHNPDVAVARAAMVTASAQEAAARQAPGATLTLSSEYANDPSTHSPWLLGGAIDVPLDTGGRREARITSAAIGVAIARYDFADTVWAARMQARRALADMLVAMREADAATRLLAFRHQQQAAMERRLKAGAVARADLERVRADVATAAATADDARGRTAGARQTLATAIGLPVEALATIAFDWADFDEPAPEPMGAIGDRIGATVARADILKAIAAYDQAESDLRGEIAKQYPAISLSPGYMWERGLTKLPLSIGLTLPPLDLNRHAIAAAQAKRAEAGRKLEAVVAAANAALDAAIMECRLARAALARVRSADLPIARRLAAQADALLRQGQIDRTDWAAAQGGVPQAELAEWAALARVHTADAALEDALRRPLEGPELMLKPGALEPAA
ncbi:MULTISPECIES: TolC family protein [unclassified Sphingobium]|uniref:TolC family protein n=1 Tax=unclassified Sphingobium TaxID=2611147 RepID=UPI0008344C87|nr:MULTISPECIES: TolC family protein [unclassified Sphingobium]